MAKTVPVHGWVITVISVLLYVRLYVHKTTQDVSHIHSSPLLIVVVVGMSRYRMCSVFFQNSTNSCVVFQLNLRHTCLKYVAEDSKEIWTNGIVFLYIICTFP